MEVNYDALSKKVLLESSQLESEVSEKQKKQFEDAKLVLLENFNDHPVTKEIDGGPDAENITNTLNGKGNLFTFIGFPAGSKPTDVIRQFIEENIVLVKRDKKMVRNNAEFRFTLLLPIDELKSITPLPYESGNSWIDAIENGISGFNHYIYLRLQSDSSRSGKGFQVPSEVSSLEYSPIPYLTPLFQKFLEECII